MLKLPKPKLSDMPVILKVLKRNCSGAFLKNKAFMSAHQTTSLSFRINGYADHLGFLGMEPLFFPELVAWFVSFLTVHSLLPESLGHDAYDELVGSFGIDVSQLVLAANSYAD